MAISHAPVLSFIAGVVSKLALARVDVSRLKFAAEIQTNWFPRAVGPMMLRPGLRYLDATIDAEAVLPLPFIFSHTDTAIVEISASAIRVRVADNLINRPAVTAAMINGSFTDLALGWTTSATGGAVVTMGGGALVMNALPFGSTTLAQQALTINQLGVEHALRIVVANGPVAFRIGSVGSEDDVFSATLLGTGTHSLAFTPAVSPVYIQFRSTSRREITVTSCEVEGPGLMELPVPWAAADIVNVSSTQSGDVIYLANAGYQQRKLERRTTRSWSIVLYQPTDGPFRITASADLILTPSAGVGNITLVASQPFFKADLVGSLIRMFNTSQIIDQDIADEDTFTDTIRVTGVSTDPTTSPPTIGTRAFTITVSGTWVGTLTLQRSTEGADAGFSDIITITANGTTTIDDHFDNSIIWYRVGFTIGNYTSGVAEVVLNYPSGGGSGIVRITAVSGPQAALAEVMFDLTSTVGTRDWEEGEWSNRYGWPSCTTLHEGRLWWFGRDRIWGSISDAFESFDDTVKGDSGPISRSIGYGPVEVINFALPLQRLILGLQSSEASVKSTTFDQPLTPTNFSIKDCSTQGSARVPAVKIDTRGVFIQQSKRKVYQLLYQIEVQDYAATDLTVLRPDIESDLMRIAVQRQPDTRIHVVRADGDVMVLLFEPTEEVVCWYNVHTDGEIEQVCVLPGDKEDKVYYYVKRTINGETVRYVERYAPVDVCQGGTLNHQADAYVEITQASSTTITGLGHLEGETVVVWANGKDLGTESVASGAITVSEAVETAIVGLPYTAQFKSAKLAYGAQLGTALTQKKRIDHLGLILHNTHAFGLEFGQSFDRMDPLPLVYQGAPVDPDRVYDEFDQPMIVLPGKWDTDARLCLLARAPRPVTVLGAVVGMDTKEKT